MIWQPLECGVAGTLPDIDQRPISCRVVKAGLREMQNPEIRYKPRIIDTILAERLKAKGAILIEGPKWCGKTTTGMHHASSIVVLDDPSVAGQNLQLAELDPLLLLEGPTPRLVDEWQLAPQLWDAVRYEVDQRHVAGQFLLTRSAVPPDTARIHHSGTGRFSWVRMRPMSLYESMESTGEVSLSELFSAPEWIHGKCESDLETLAFLACRGGWPGAVDAEEEKTALLHAVDYYEGIVRSDISRVDGALRNKERVRQLMRSYARHQGTQTSNNVLAADSLGNGTDGPSRQTVASYLSALQQIFVIEEMDAWNPNLRSKTAIRTSPTRYYTDPSIATAALGAGPDDLIADLETFGLIFEAMCIRDLRVYAQAIGGTVYHYRDKDDLECDAVVHVGNGAYGLVEIKLGGDRAIEDGAHTLAKLRDKLDYTRMKKPSFLMVLVGRRDYAYRRKDGIYVVPVRCLKD